MMPRIRSDDGPRKLRAVWLGPEGMTLPFEWTYVQWAVCLALGNLFGLIVGGLMWWATALVYGIAAFFLWGYPIGILVGVKVMKGVTFDEPIQYRAAMARGQLRDRGQPITGQTRWAVTWPPLRPFTPAVDRALGPRADRKD